MADPEKGNDDDLLRRARALKEQARQIGEDSAAEQGSGLGDYLEGNRFIASFLRIMRRLKRWTGPIGSILAWLFGLIGAGIKFAAFRRDAGKFMLDSDGDLIFSFRRLCTVLILTLAGTVALNAALSAVYFYSTYFHEMVYVTGKQEIETGELYQFGGCTSLPCSTEVDNGKFYLIETSLWFPALFYPEEEVFANIPQQNGACDIEGYGIYFRTLRWLYKHAQLYQHVVKVTCRPYTEDEIRKVINSGEKVSWPKD